MTVLTRTIASAALSLGVLATPLAGQVVVNGGTPNGGAGWNIFDDNRAATMFSLPGSTGFDLIRFWGILFQSAPYSPTIFWQILADAGGTPGTSVVSEGNALASSTLRADLGGGAYSWQFDLAVGAQTLANGIYWLALHDGPLDPSGFTGSSLLWETSDAPGAYAIQTFSIDPTWIDAGNTSLAFQLQTVTTPEPGSLALLATGLFSMGGAGFWRRRATRMSRVAMLKGGSMQPR